MPLQKGFRVADLFEPPLFLTVIQIKVSLIQVYFSTHITNQNKTTIICCVPSALSQQRNLTMCFDVVNGYVFLVVIAFDLVYVVRSFRAISFVHPLPIPRSQAADQCLLKFD